MSRNSFLKRLFKPATSGLIMPDTQVQECLYDLIQHRRMSIYNTMDYCVSKRCYDLENLGLQLKRELMRRKSKYGRTIHYYQYELVDLKQAIELYKFITEKS